MNLELGMALLSFSRSISKPNTYFGHLWWWDVTGCSAILSNLAIELWGYVNDIRVNFTFLQGLRLKTRHKMIIYRDELNWLFDFKWFINRLQTIRKNELVLKGHLKNDFKMEYFECSTLKKKKIEQSKTIYTDIINYW